MNAAQILRLTAVLFVFATSQPPSPPPNCTDKLIAISPCLGYLSDPPNNLTANVTSQCCDAVFSVFNSGDGVCLCYLVRKPLILGFPLNESRVNELSSVCKLKNESFARSLESFCPASPALPPLHMSRGSETSKPQPPLERNITVSGTSNHSHSGLHNASSPSAEHYNASMSMAPGAVSNSPARANSSLEAAERADGPPISLKKSGKVSAATKRDHNSTDWFLPGAIVFLIFHIITHASLIP